MSVNRDRPHVFVRPEDDAYRQIAREFALALDWSVQRSIQVLPPAGGWRNVLDWTYVERVLLNPRSHIVLLIDFDGRLDRLADSLAEVPPLLADRTFLLGVLSEPEHLKPVLGSYGTIGRALAADCRDDTVATWRHDLLRHNEPELRRLINRVKPFLFPAS